MNFRQGKIINTEADKFISFLGKLMDYPFDEEKDIFPEGKEQDDVYIRK